MENIVKVSISIEASVHVTDQMKDKIKSLNPFAYEQYKNDEEALAMIAFYDAMDLLISKKSNLNEHVKGLKVVTI
jgi:hypothetical protein